MRYLLGLSAVIANGCLQRNGVAFKRCSALTTCRGRTYTLSMSGSNEVLEKTVCNVREMQDGEMKEVDFGEHGKALLVRDNGQFSALGALCTHHKAPLIKGAFYQGRIRCPWHGACFNTQTGDIEDYPGLDSLQVFDVVVRDGEVVVRAQKDKLENIKRQKLMACRKKDYQGKIVIVGSGGAGLTCAESLRQQSYAGEITVVSKDSRLPYDRTKLSKNLAIDLSSIVLRDNTFYEKHDINIRLSTAVTKVDTTSKSVVLENGDTLKYEKLLLCPGAIPRRLRIPGSNLKNIFTLRSADDAAAIIAAATGKNVVVIGASFIGMEAASSLIGKAASVTVCEYFAAPYQTVLGEEVGKVFQDMHEERGIRFKMGAIVTDMEGSDGAVKSVVLKDGTTIEADVVILGVGVQPATGFLSGSNVELNEHGFVKVNKYLETNIEDVYAAGDIALFPLKMRHCEPVNIQHWSMAHYHGNLVGRNMVQRNTYEVESIPFFWSNLGPGKNVRYTGYGLGYDDVVFTGSLTDRKFCAYYCKGDEVVALSTFMMDPKASMVAEKWHNGEKILKKDIR